MKIKKLNEIFYDDTKLMSGKIRFFLANPKTNKGFTFDIDKEDKEKLEEIFKRNNISFNVDDGGDLPF